jgi:hypothetical protein
MKKSLAVLTMVLALAACGDGGGSNFGASTGSSNSSGSSSSSDRGTVMDKSVSGSVSKSYNLPGSLASAAELYWNFNLADCEGKGGPWEGSKLNRCFRAQIAGAGIHAGQQHNINFDIDKTFEFYKLSTEIKDIKSNELYGPLEDIAHMAAYLILNNDFPAVALEPSEVNKKILWFFPKKETVEWERAAIKEQTTCRDEVIKTVDPKELITMQIAPDYPYEKYPSCVKTIAMKMAVAQGIQALYETLPGISGDLNFILNLNKINSYFLINSVYVMNAGIDGAYILDNTNYSKRNEDEAVDQLALTITNLKTDQVLLNNHLAYKTIFKEVIDGGITPGKSPFNDGIYVGKIHVMNNGAGSKGWVIEKNGQTWQGEKWVGGKSYDVKFDSTDKRSRSVTFKETNTNDSKVSSDAKASVK